MRIRVEEFANGAARPRVGSRSAAFHAPIMQRIRRECMRSMRHFPQVPQILPGASGLDCAASAVGVRFHPFGALALQPLSQFIPPKPPLPSDLDGGKLMAFRPKA